VYLKVVVWLIEGPTPGAQDAVTVKVPVAQAELPPACRVTVYAPLTTFARA